MTEEHEEHAVVVADVSPASLVAHDPTAALENTEKLVKYMADKQGTQFIANIQGKKYPKVEWWTTVGLALGLSPVEISSERIELESGGYKYLAKVEVRRGDQVVTSASAICSTEERSWGNRDEYAVKSMATTRATGKAYRIGLSALAVMAGLEPTPADEIPPQGFQDRRRAPATPPPVSQANQEALDALRRLHGEDQPARIAFIKEVLAPKEINHPNEIADDEWVKVKEAAIAAAESTEGEQTEMLDF